MQAGPAPVQPQGALAYGLSDSGQLLSFGLDNPAQSLSARAVTGTDAPLVDLDVNPKTGALFGFTAGGKAYTLDPATGTATLNATPGAALTLVAADFNPVANRVRVLGQNAGNARLSVDPAPAAAPAGTVTADGTFAFAVGDANAGTTPQLVGAAYTSSYKNGGTAPASTSLYTLDAATDSLILNTVAPQFSTLTTVGKLGIDLTGTAGFDIVTAGAGGASTAHLTSGTGLYTVDLMTGATQLKATLKQPMRGLAVSLP